VLVKLRKDKTTGVANRCNNQANANGGSLISVYKKVFKEGGCAIKLNRSQVAKMKLDVAIESVEEDQLVHASGCNIQADGSCSVSAPTWGLNRIDQCSLPLSTSSAFQKMPAKDVRVFILDTGVNGNHQEFTGMIGPDDGTCHWTNYPEEGSALNDGQGHGTHVAGIVAGETYGVAYCHTSNNNCDLCAVKVLSSSGGGTIVGVIDGLEHVMTNCPNGKKCIANMSFGGGLSSALNEAVDSVVASGITVVVAAGNEGTDACSKSPASAGSAITVGATQQSDAPSDFSNYGSCVNVWSPGSSITSAWIGSNTMIATISGTSMASPRK